MTTSVFDSPDTTPWRQELLKNILFIILIADGIVGILNLLQGWDRFVSAVGNLLVFLVIGGLLLTTRKGKHIDLISHSLVTFLWILITVVIFVNEGLSSPVYVVYYIITLIAGLLLTIRLAIFWSILSIVIVIIVYFLELNNQLPEPIFLIRPESFGIASIGILIVGIFLTIVSINLVKNSIYQRNMAQIEVKKLNLELEERVLTRTKELEKANRELESFSSTVSHDLQGPLQNMISYSKLLSQDIESNLSQNSSENMQKIRFGLNNMSTLIDKLLEFSLLGKKSLSIQKISTKNIVNEVIKSVNDQQRLNGIKISLNDVPDCMGDPNLIKQVWINLISNAVKYTRNSTNPKIEISSKLDNDSVVFFVRDNGIGFDMQFADSVFDIFKRLHDNEDEYEGAGIGLANVKRIIDLHDGKIWVKSKINQQTTFYFKIGK